MTFKTRLAVESLDSRTWALLEPLVYEGSKSDTIIVDAGEETDFASVPNWLQSFTPRTGAWTKAAVIHDMLCRELNEVHRFPFARKPGTEVALINAVDTDGIFRLIMKEAGVSAPRRWLMWTGVRWGALANPARRSGWLSTAPAVLGISAVTLAALLGALALITWVVPW